jgi:hypothetical protein
VNHMTVKAHLAELERQHKALEDEIAEAMAHSSTDNLKIAELKRRKLQLKDEIERQRHDHTL